MEPRRVLALIAALTAISCGGGSDDAPVASTKATCGAVAACGGNPVGAWHSASSCLALTGSPDAYCAESSFAGEGITAVATVEYRADGTFTLKRSFAGNVAGVVPASCLSKATPPLTCDTTQKLLNQQGARGGCTDTADGGCNCSFDFTAADTDRNGTYSVINNILTLSYQENGAAKTEVYDLCVKGNELLVSPHGQALQIALPFIGTGKFIGDIVFAK